ncbi:MAG TPA: DUF397 domain-containing protein [Pseudonocardiaceae bacterium]
MSEHAGSRWTRSSLSLNGDCVEWSASADGSVLVRDSKDPDGPVLRFTRSEWAAFVGGAKLGEADLP